MASLEEELKHSRFENENVKAMIHVMFTANFLGNQINSMLREYNLSQEQFNVLRILRGKHPACMCQKDILSRMIAKQSNLTLIVKKLVQKGFVSVEKAAHDRREYMITITQKGLDLLEILDREMKANSAELNRLTVSEAFHLNALLDKLRGA